MRQRRRLGVDPDSAAAEDAPLTCLGIDPADSRIVASADSAEYTRGEPPASTQLRSSTVVVMDASAAAKDVAAYASPSAPKCLSAALATMVGADGPGVVQPFAVPQAAPGSFGYLIGLDITSGGTQVGFSAQLVGAAVGAAEVQILAFSQTDVVPPAELGRVLSLLVERARQAQAR